MQPRPPDTRKYALSPPYAAPEQWRGERSSSVTDVYAMGVVAYEVLAGVPPFQGPERHDYRRQHLEDMPRPISGVSPRLQASIDSCLYKSPEARPKPQSLLAQLDRGVHLASDSVRRLQEANVLSVQQRAEIARQQSVAKSAAERRRDLGRAADQSLAGVISLLHHQIVSNAPESRRTGSLPTGSWTLNEATLSVETFRCDGGAPPY